MTTNSLIAPVLMAVTCLATGCGGDDSAASTGGGAGAPSQGPAKTEAAVAPLAGEHSGPVRVVYRPDGVAFQPDDAAWEQAPARVIALIAQMITPPVGGGSTRMVAARAMHDGQWLAIRMRWQDDDPDQAVGVDTFRDSVAVGFPTVGEVLPSPFMGDPTSPVGIWQWTADFDANARGQGTFADAYPHTEGVWYFPQDYMVTRTVRAWRGSEPVIEFEARGFGSLTRKGTQNVRGAGRHDGVYWSVVLRRRLGTGNPQDVRFRPGESTAAIFAVWDGGVGEVNGIKSITPMWIPFELEDTLTEKTDEEVR